MCREKTLLYYPNIKIEDGVWLRNAILYWDNVASIVPSSNYGEMNSIEIEYLRNAGLYTPLYPFDLQINMELYEEFIQIVENVLEQYRKQLSDRRYSRKYIDREKVSNSTIHIDKMPNTVLEILLEEGLAKRDCEGPWINMDDRFANIYMATLARYLAKTRRYTDIGTDNERKFMYPYMSSKNINKDNRQIYLNIALQDILPVPNLDIPIQDIIEFKIQYKKQLRDFRHRIDRIQSSLSECNDEEEFEDRIYYLKSEMDNDLQEIDELMDSNRMINTKRALQMIIPLGLETGISMLGLTGNIYPMQTLFANTAVGFAAKLICTEESSHVDKDSAYLIKARQNGILTTTRKYGL